jgi:hypothetical protein
MVEKKSNISYKHLLFFYKIFLFLKMIVGDKE